MIQVGNHTVRVLATGAGAPRVVILASPLVDADLYRATAGALSGFGNIAVVDLPGSGKSSPLRTHAPMDALAASVPGIVHALGADACLLVGHSNSGIVALLAASRHPDVVAGLVLADASGAHPSSSLLPVIAGRMIDAAIEYRLTLRGVRSILRNLWRHTRHLLAQLRLAAGDATLDIAPSVQAPVLLAWGARDHTMPPIAAQRYAAALPDATIVESQSGSHDWIIEEPDAFAAAVIRWWREHSIATRRRSTWLG